MERGREGSPTYGVRDVIGGEPGMIAQTSERQIDSHLKTAGCP
jgi:hypothetical protein